MIRGPLKIQMAMGALATVSMPSFKDPLGEAVRWVQNERDLGLWDDIGGVHLFPQHIVPVPHGFGTIGILRSGDRFL